MNYKKIYFSVFILFFSAACFSQQKNPAKAGNPVMPIIKDGVYFTFEDIKKNQPNLVLENLYKSMYDSTFTLWQWAHTANLYYIDKSGTRKALNRDSIWGFSEDGTPYICLNQFFHKINTVGSISLFIEFYPLIRDPLSLVLTDSKGNSEERILDFENGNTGSYELTYFNSILVRDSALYNQFNAIKKERTKRKKMYVFLEKYNEIHPMFKN
ncbi:MAG: hypothetical protein ABIT08_07755 [Bacteroidia bacterium]